MLDIAKVRRLYFNPPPDDSGRDPTREVLWARAEPRAVHLSGTRRADVVAWTNQFAACDGHRT